MLYVVMVIRRIMYYGVLCTYTRLIRVVRVDTQYYRIRVIRFSGLCHTLQTLIAGKHQMHTHTKAPMQIAPVASVEVMHNMFMFLFMITVLMCPCGRCCTLKWMTKWMTPRLQLRGRVPSKFYILLSNTSIPTTNEITVLHLRLRRVELQVHYQTGEKREQAGEGKENIRQNAIPHGAVVPSILRSCHQCALPRRGNRQRVGGGPRRGRP